MSFLISAESELLKTKRTATFWLTLGGAALVPTIFFFVFWNNKEDWSSFQKDPWSTFFSLGWQILSVFLLPMYIILSSTLIPQIEVKNNTWKQVFSSPQPMGNIFFSKFLTIQLMILLCFVLFNILMLAVGAAGSLINTNLNFLSRPIDVQMLLKLNLKMYISTLGISAIQYALSLRFKNFVAPVGVGLALVIGSIIAMNVHWKHIYKYPYAYPMLTLDAIKKHGSGFLENHEWNSIGYLVLFLLIGFLDMKLKREKG